MISSPLVFSVAYISPFTTKFTLNSTLLFSQAVMQNKLTSRHTIVTKIFCRFFFIIQPPEVLLFKIFNLSIILSKNFFLQFYFNTTKNIVQRSTDIRMSASSILFNIFLKNILLSRRFQYNTSVCMPLKIRSRQEDICKTFAR